MVEVLDRRKPDGSWNMLRDNHSSGLYVIDFGKGLTSCLHVILGGALEPLEPPYPLSIRRVANESAALATCNLIEAMGEPDLENIVSSVPPSWIGEPARARIKQFLIERAGSIREICQRMHAGEPS